MIKRSTKSDGERRATGSDGERRGATGREEDGERRGATESDGERREATGNDGEFARRRGRALVEARHVWLMARQWGVLFEVRHLMLEPLEAPCCPF